jgi:colanic acid/amylovoran biosynthesis glycosyltransferase
MPPEAPRIGYVTKVLAPLSEPSVVAELLAHERAGLDVDVFSLRPSTDGGAHTAHARLRASAIDVPDDVTVGALFEETASAGAGAVPGLLDLARDEHPRELLQALRLAQLVRRRGIGHLHAHCASAGTVTRLASRVAGVRYSVTAHASDIFRDDVRPEALGGMLSDAAAVVAVSDHDVAALRALCPRLGRRLHRVYNGLDLARLPFTAPAARPARIVAVERLMEQTDLADLVAACGLLAAGGWRFECRIVCDDAQLRARAAALGLEHVVTFVEPASVEAVREEVAAAAVLAMPRGVRRDGSGEGLPTVLLEAMALGTPCVATDVGAIHEVLLDRHTGLVLSQRDPAALARALGALLDDADLRVRLARAARRVVEKRFGIVETSAAWRAVVLTPPQLYADAGESVERLPIA